MINIVMITEDLDAVARYSSLNSGVYVISVKVHDILYITAHTSYCKANLFSYRADHKYLDSDTCCGNIYSSSEFSLQISIFSIRCW